jgi:probable rRNA maturation factor
MAGLNERYRGKKGPTDVLSFLRDEPDERARGVPAESRLVAGDLALSLEMLRRNAAAFECTEEEELKRLAVHGILHLAGMDHGRGHGGRMLALQERLLKQLEAERIVGEQTL